MGISAPLHTFHVVYAEPRCRGCHWYVPAGQGGHVRARVVVSALIASPVPQKVCGVHAVAPLPPPLLYVSLGHRVHRASSRVISVPLPGTRYRADGRDAGLGALQIRVSPAPICSSSSSHPGLSPRAEWDAVLTPPTKVACGAAMVRLSAVSDLLLGRQIPNIFLLTGTNMLQPGRQASPIVTGCLPNSRRKPQTANRRRFPNSGSSNTCIG